VKLNIIAYKIYKELERLLKEKNSELSPEKEVDIAKTIYQIQKNNLSNTNKRGRANNKTQYNYYQ